MTEPMRRRPRHPDDQGFAMLAVLLVMAVVGVLTVTAASLTVSNIGNSG